ncbi:MAG: Gfo/Idh/MocA family oxidoreductase [Cyclobacteriaceae bacterium]|nr:Gfo/Idh/MocA family oxidoreductase [Cyclobacteriaceae bacterium]
MKRRTFINNSVKGLAIGMAAPTIFTSCTKSANSQILIGHIGVGSMGSAVLKSWIMPTVGSLTVATCDTYLKRREGAADYVNRTYKDQGIKAPECQAFLDMDELLARKDIDAVAITTPDHWHVLAAIKAARAGKHILLAKPLGLSYPDYKILEQETKANGVKFHYGTQQRAQEHMKMAVNTVKEGKIGDIERIEVWAPGKNPVLSPQCIEVPVPPDFDYNRWTGPAPLNTYCPDRVTNDSSWFQWDYSIGFLAGWGAHPLDIMVWAMKDKLSGKYTCEGTGSFWEPGGIYNNIYSWDLHYKYDSGVEMRFMSTDVVEANDVWNYREAKDGNSTTFFGTKGWISVGRHSAESNVPEINSQFKEFPRDAENGRIIDHGHRTGQEFIDVINGKMNETNPLEEAILSDCVSHMGDIALRTGRQITWDPSLGKVVDDGEANKLFVRELRNPYTV